MAAGGLAAVAIPSAYYYFGDTAFEPALAQPKALSQIWDEATIIEIGTKYRSMVPDESSQRALVWLLKSQTENSDAEKNAVDDFTANRHVLVDGWILAVTEARQCALASIDQAKS